MKITKITPWVIFALVLLLAWMTLGGSSGYYDGPPPAPAAPGASSKYTMKSAMAYMGSDMGSYPIGDSNSCASICDTNSRCAGFVIDPKGACMLKRSFRGPGVMTANRNTYAKPGIDLP